MGKVIQLPPREARTSPSNKTGNKASQDTDTMRLLKISDEIDAVILKHIQSGADPRDMAGLLAHRLGTLMRHIEEKDDLWDVCERVLKGQAAIE